MELKPGYKQTEVGVIPEDWDVKPLSMLPCEAIDCHYSTPIWKESGELVIRNQNIRDGRLSLEAPSYTGENNFQERTRRAVPRHPDLVITREAPMGEVCMIPVGLKCCLGQRMVLLRIQSDNVDASYVLHALQSQSSRCFIGSVGGTGSTVGNIRIPILKSLPVALPEFVEQTNISAALDDINTLIIKLERLIAKKHDIKQAAMQELLTGKRRLPGFEGEWVVKRLKQLAEISTGINKPLSEMGSGALYVTVQDLYDKTSIRTDRLSRIKVSAGEIETRSLTKGDIVFGKSSVKRDGIGYPSQFFGCSEPVVFSGFTYRARALRGIADPTFLFYALRAEKTRRWLIDNSQASALTNINQKIADSIPISVPPCLLEQTAIAAIISEMDAELFVLEARRGKAHELKQGMMQQLLTGKIRLS
ncbi:MAG: restriction endonuclease subunit S [Cyanobium sp.]